MADRPRLRFPISVTISYPALCFQSRSTAGWRAVVFTGPAHFFYTYIDRVITLPGLAGVLVKT